MADTASESNNGSSQAGSRSSRVNSADSIPGGRRSQIPRKSLTNGRTSKASLDDGRSPRYDDYEQFLQETRNGVNSINGMSLNGDAIFTNEGRNGLINYGDAAADSPLYDKSTGLPKSFPKPKSALEDDEDDMHSLDGLKLKDQEYQKLLRKTKQEDEDDDTLLLLGGSKYDPTLGRSKAEASAADRIRDREQLSRGKLATKLKTLHLELRSARRGIDYIERRLNGVGSSDEESDWVDDEEDPTGQILARRVKADGLKQVEKLKAANLVDIAEGQPTESPVYLAQEPVKWSVSGKWAFTIGQLILVWFLLEIFYL